jgi:hypothetical protein
MRERPIGISSPLKMQKIETPRAKKDPGRGFFKWKLTTFFMRAENIISSHRDGQSTYFGGDSKKKSCF